MFMKKRVIGALVAALAVTAALPVNAMADKVGGTGIPELNREEHMKYMNGYSDGTFRPDAPIKRSEACKLIAGLLKEGNSGGDYLFMDVPADAWYFEAVSQLTGYDLLGGFPDGSFRPESSITRAQFVTILSRFPHTDIGTEAEFADVPATHWAHEAVQVAVAQGWTNGYPDGTFKPDKTITRAEAVAMLNRILGRQGDQIMSATGNGIPVMSDVPDTHWAYLDMLEAITAHSYEKTDGHESWTEFEKSTTTLAEGWHNIGGELFHVNADKRFDRNTTVEGLQLDRNGRYTTGSEELDKLLTEAANKVLTSAMTQEERLRAMYDYAKETFSYLGIGEVDTTQEGWDIDQALQMLRTKEGNCYSWGAAFTHLARKVGYPAQAIPGTAVSPKGNESVHTWTEITIDGTPYTFDPQMESVYAKRYDEHYDLYMKKYGEANWEYKRDDICNLPLAPEEPEVPEADAELVDIMTKVYGTQGMEGMVQTVLFNGMGGTTSMPLSWYIGTDELEFDAGLASEPMISSIPHSVVLLRMKEGADIEAAVATIREKIDPRKWICVGVEDKNVKIENVGDYILIAMDDENAQSFVDNFRLAVSGTGSGTQ